MKKYFWRGFDEENTFTSGCMTARNKRDAQQKLADQNIFVLSLKRQWMVFSPRAHAEQVADFIEQLQLLIAAHVPLITALQVLSETTPHVALQTIIREIAKKIRAGETLANSVRDYPRYFNAYVCHVIAAGESADQLAAVLAQLVHYLEQQRALNNKIKKAAVYPTCVLILSIIMTVGLLLFAVPQFQSLYANFNAPLPALTQQVIFLSHLFISHGVFCVIAVSAIIFTLRQCYFRYRAVLYNLPCFRAIFILHALTQWLQYLSLLLNTHHSLSNALPIANRIVQHPSLQPTLKTIHERILAGASFYEALSHARHFPKTLMAMIFVGDNADCLTTVITNIAARYQILLDHRLDALSKLLEPVMMIGVASLIALIILALYLPIFQMGGLL